MSNYPRTLFVCTSVCQQTQKSFIRKFTSLLFLIILLGFSAQAQNARPSCNISGSLESINGSAGEITVNVEVAKSGPNPNLVYTFDNNAAGDYISNYGPIIYNAATNTATQSLRVVAGPKTKGYKLTLTVTNAGAACRCSKSVSVTRQ